MHLLFFRRYHKVEAHVSGVWELDRSDGVASRVGPQSFIALVELLNLLAAARIQLETSCTQCSWQSF